MGISLFREATLLGIVRQDRVTPVQESFLAVFMGLLSDEQHVRRVVGQHNIVSPYSDHHEREMLPAVWVPRGEAVAAA